MEYEDVLRRVGEFGRYQRFLYSLGALLSIGIATSSYGYVFVTAFVDHWCHIPGIRQLNLTLEQIKDLSLPIQDTNGVSWHRWVDKHSVQ